VTSMAIVVAGTLVAALAAAVVQPVLVVVAALVLGAGYGCCQVYGLITLVWTAAQAREARVADDLPERRAAS
jgi:hypothetical protein